MKQMSRKSKRGKFLARYGQRLRREGQRLASVLLCASLVAGNLSTSAFRALADSDSDNEFTYEIEHSALQEALQTAVSEGNTVNEELEFSGEHAEEYEELLEADGTLYELELPDNEDDEDNDRDKALNLRVFARIEGDIPVDEIYEIDGSEEIVFLVSNKTEETVTATICVDDLETETITVLPAASIPVEESTEVEGAAALTNAVSSAVSVGGSGSGGSGGSSGSSAATTEDISSTEEDLVIEITESADNNGTEADAIVEDTDVTVLDDENGDDVIAEENNADVNDPEEENSSSDQAKADDADVENTDNKDSGEAADDTANAEADDADAQTDDTETGNTGSGENEDDSSDTADAEADNAADTEDAGSNGNTSDAAGENDEDADNTSDNDAGSDITEDSEVSVLGSAISIHNSVLLAAGKATDSDAEEEASSSDAAKAVDGIVYESVLFDKKGTAAFATTAADLKLDEIVYVEYTAQENDVTVTVTAQAGALPSGAQLSVSLYDEDSEEYAAAGESVGYDAEDETTGMAAIDITFYDEDGEEIEPLVPVTVSIDVSEIVPESADTSTIEIQHLTETEDGIEPVLVADVTGDTDGIVDTETVIAEFEVESFSSFVITWYTWINDQYYSVDIEATTYLSGTTTVIGRNGSTTLSFLSNNPVDLTSLAVDGYEFDYATVNYGNNSETADTMTVSIARQESGQGHGPGSNTIQYTYYYNSQQFYQGTTPAENVSISLYYKEVLEPTVTITTVQTDTGYILTANPSNFTNTEGIDYNWSLTDDTYATLVSNDDGTATLTWKDGVTMSESSSDGGDNGNGVSVNITVTASSTYTDEESENEITETAEDSLTLSAVYVKVYVYVAAYDDDGNRFSDEMLELLGIDSSTLDGNGYFPAGEIQLNVSFLSGKDYTTWGSPLLTSEDDWIELLAALSEMDTTTLYNMTGMRVTDSAYAIDYTGNKNNNVGDYISMAAQDIGYSWGSQHSAMFHWNESTSYGFYDQTVRYHLDLRFSTNKITFITGNNNITDGDAKDGTTIDSRVYITGSEIKDTENLIIPDGYKLAGYYADPEMTILWDEIGNPITEDITVYIKLLPENELVLYYVVAQGEGTLSSYSEGVMESASAAVGSTATAAEGWQFEGWYFDLECTQEITVDVTGITLTPTKPTDGWVDGTTYYAKFVPISYDITLVKVDSTSSTTTLSGASFVLSSTDGEENTSYYSYKNGTVTWAESEEGSTLITTGEGGTETIHSLSAGYTYTLTETKAPDGYNLLSDSITFTVSGGKVTGAIYGSGTTTGVVSVSEDGKTITVANTAGSALPESGGPGTLPFRVAGLLLMSVSAYLIYDVFKRRTYSAF